MLCRGSERKQHESLDLWVHKAAWVPCKPYVGCILYIWYTHVEQGSDAYHPSGSYITDELSFLFFFSGENSPTYLDFPIYQNQISKQDIWRSFWLKISPQHSLKNLETQLRYISKLTSDWRNISISVSVLHWLFQHFPFELPNFLSNFTYRFPAQSTTLFPTYTPSACHAHACAHTCNKPYKHKRQNATHHYTTSICTTYCKFKPTALFGMKG